MIMNGFTLLERLKADRKGITALEYAILASVIVAAVGIAAGLLSTDLKTTFTNIGASL